MAETLCWRCKRPGTGSCAWDKSKGNTPVDGWTAEEVPYMSWCRSRATTTFVVIDCPLFVPEENYKQRCNYTYREPANSEERKQIERLFGYGRSNKEIAEQFSLSLKTVRDYKTQWRKENNK